MWTNPPSEQRDDDDGCAESYLCFEGDAPQTPQNEKDFDPSDYFGE